MADVSILNVNLYDETIGTITNVGGDKTLFAFTDSYIEDEKRPTLGLSFKDQHGDLIKDYRTYRKSVMPFFSNLLPEGHLRKYLAERAGVNHEREFHLLWALGNDLPGAITITSDEGDSWSIEKPKVEGDDDHLHENAMRFSLAGVQLKFSAIEDASGGLTIPAKGAGGSWIVKLPSREFDGVPENEFSMMQLATMIGMNVPKIGLVEMAGIQNVPDRIERFGRDAFVIERFDRLSDGTRVHIEDFAQVYGIYAEDKYKKASMRNIAQVIAAEGSPEDLNEFIRRVTFSMIIGNGDMHLKNWSLVYPDRRNVSLAPAYDFVSTVPYIPNEGTGLNISRSKSFTDFNIDELEHLSAKVSIPKKLVLSVARDTVSSFREIWQQEAANLPMSKAVREAIETHMKTVPIVEELS